MTQQDEASRQPGDQVADTDGMALELAADGGPIQFAHQYLEIKGPIAPYVCGISSKDIEIMHKGTVVVSLKTLFLSMPDSLRWAADMLEKMARASHQEPL